MMVVLPYPILLTLIREKLPHFIEDFYSSKMEKKISKPSFETWLKSTKAYMLQGDILTVTAPNEFARDWLEERYSHLINYRCFPRQSLKLE